MKKRIFGQKSGFLGQKKAQKRPKVPSLLIPQNTISLGLNVGTSTVKWSGLPPLLTSLSKDLSKIPNGFPTNQSYICHS